MNRKHHTATVVAITVALGITSYAWGGCNTTFVDGDVTKGYVTGASDTYELSGQGNSSCADLNMRDITFEAGTTIVASDPNDPDYGVPNGIDWSTSEEVDAVVVEPANGARCVYLYPKISKSGQFLTPGSDKDVKSTYVCTNDRPGILAATQSDDTPITTAGTGCTGDIVVEGNSIFADPTQEIAIFAENLQGDLVASCNQAPTGTATTLAAATSTSTSSQEYCEDRCVNFEDRGETPECLSTANPVTGEFSLNLCRPCDTALQVNDPPVHPEDVDENGDPVPMEFCWEKVNSVCEENDLAGCAEGRNVGTMLKHSPVRQSDFQTTWYNRCRTSTITLNGIDYTTTTCK